MRVTLPAIMSALGCLLTASLASAHVSVANAGAYANTSFEAAFSVGHGCEGLDTYSLKINIPEGVTSVRVMESGVFTQATLEKDDAGNVTSVTFSKDQSAVRAEDDAFYKLVVRMKLPDAPFKTLYFPTTQTCKSADGSTTKTTEWIGEGDDPKDADGNELEPAPMLMVMPARTPGWNQYTTPDGVHLMNLAKTFGDALIVWAEGNAFSVNSNTADQIEAEDGVDTLKAIHPNTDFWVKY